MNRPPKQSDLAGGAIAYIFLRSKLAPIRRVRQAPRNGRLETGERNGASGISSAVGKGYYPGPPPVALRCPKHIRCC
ncbi:hypothetical protein MTBUT4_460015 [Magnetospirillum sp. UT-4]|nr:hypothetical protein MTBUT4_460015 [Magnetospirillum sp. UT-4]